MESSENVLAIDLGASSGRVTLASFDGETIKLQEIHRFSNEPVWVNGTLYWDILRLFHEIKRGIALAAKQADIKTIGIDTWGCDFALIDEFGRMIEMPVHYRDLRTKDYQKLFERIDKSEIYETTGTQFLQINTIYHLNYIAQNRADDLNRAQNFMMIPDLLNYFLTGTIKNEYTNATNAQLLDARKREWSTNLLGKLGIRKDIFSKISMPGTPCGKLLPEIVAETKASQAEVICVASHDTGSAVVSIPTQDENVAFLSSGTWSLIGTELSEPCTNEKAHRHNFTNEGGADGNIRFLKNIMGTWLIQEARQQWARDGQEYSFEELEKMAMESEGESCFIDVDNPIFLSGGDIPAKIKKYCENAGQNISQEPGAIIRAINENLAFKYRYAIEELEICTNKKFNALHIVGGGVQSEMLCQMTANAVGIPVYAGPVEATVLGNAAIQMISIGALESIPHARAVIAKTMPIKKYKQLENWERRYQEFKKQCCNI